MTVLLETVHGSRLYGLAHAGSDHDVYRVVDSWHRARKNDVHHSVRGGEDVVTVGLSTFMRFCEAGVPQALEAMFSTRATVDELADLRRAYRAGDAARATYMRTAKSFILSDDPKRQRHAMRLLLNLQDLTRTGRFDPTLSEVQLGAIAMCMQDPRRGYELLKYAAVVAVG